MKLGFIVWSIFCSLFGCSKETDTTTEEPVVLIDPVPLEGSPLTSLKLARRISLDLRGEYLSLDEVETIQNTPEDLDQLIDSWLETPAHKEQLIALFASMTLTKIDIFNVDHGDYYLDDSLSFEFVRSIGEEPVRLMAEIATEDRPWTDLVTVDFSMANELLLEIWDLEPVDSLPTEERPWVKAKFQDGRPAGGLISTNGLWWRHYTTPNNRSRSRSSFLTKLLVCDNHFTRETGPAPVLRADVENVDAMALEDPVCRTCHITLDPVAAALYGFWQHDIHDVLELETYHAEREWLGEQDLNIEMSWYGQPLATPGELGLRISEDERFLTCAVSSLAERLWRRPLVEDDQGRLQQLLFAFQDSELRYSALIKAILLSPEYQLGSADLSGPRAKSAAKITHPAQIASAVKELTGFVWKQDGTLLLDNDEEGFRTLLGGIDGLMVNSWASEPSSSRQLTMKRFAQLAADYGVETAWETPSALELFDQQNLLDVDSSSPEFQEILEHLSLRISGEEINSEQISLHREMFSFIESSNGRKQAWKSLLSVLLRDSEAWIY